MNPRRVTLTIFEMELAAIAGVKRRTESMRKGLHDRHGSASDSGRFIENGWDIDIEGACGEMAASKALDRYWSGSVNSYKENDITGLQVRTSMSHDRSLIIRRNDSDNDRFVLVTGRAPEFMVWGWITGSEGKRPEWLKDPGGREAAWFVPKTHLHAIGVDS